MSAVNANDFVPSSVVVEPANRPDQLADAVLAGLNRGRWGYRGRPWGLVKTVILSYISLGILPLLVWPRRFRNFMRVEEQQLSLLADWLKLRTGRAEADDLRDGLARQMGPEEFGGTVQMLLVVFAILLFVQLVLQHSFDLGMLWSAAWSFDHRWRGEGYRRFLYLWGLLLTAGYFVHWLGVCRHAGILEAYVNRFNEIVGREGVPPVRVPRVGVGLDPLWTVAAVIGLANGCLWAAPLALGGVVQSRYVMKVSRQARADMGSRVRSMLAGNRPAVDLRATPRAPSTLCGNERCRAPVRLGAGFCQRCGARAG